MDSAFCSRGLAALTQLAIAMCLLGGPLDPPAGPIAPTPGSEPRIAINATNTPGDADSLFKVTQHGSYYLAVPITGVAGRSGIEIATSNGVTIDLMGYSLQGVAGSFHGISTSGVHGLIIIRNGWVGGWGSHAIELNGGFTGEVSTVENVHVMYNGGWSVRAATRATIRDCVASGNAVGFQAQQHSLIVRCTARNNNGTGTQAGSTVSECVADANLRGFSFSGGSTAIGCTAANNVNDGFEVSGAVLTSCAANNNGGSGFACGNGCTIDNCVAYSNTSHGISRESSCVIRNNLANLNGNSSGSGANIRVAQGSNRVEGNNCIGGDWGIQALGAGNVIVRNTCRGNTLNWSIAANNVVVPIINRTAPASGAISGDSGPSSLGSTDANANYTY